MQASAVDDPTPALQAFDGDPRRAADLARFLGFDPIDAPTNLLANQRNALTDLFDKRDDHFGVVSLMRVGSANPAPGSVGLYVAELDEWGSRASARDRARRRIARALVHHGPEDRTMFILVPNDLERPSIDEGELVMPRVRVDGKGGLTTVRALINLQDPNRFHRDLLRRLRIAPGAR